MKKTPIICSVVAILLSVVAIVLNLAGGKKSPATTIQGEGTVAIAGDIVYVQIDSLIANYDMYNDLMSAFQTKAQGVQEELNKKGRKLESDMKSFENQINKGLLTRSAAEQQQNSLLSRQQDLQNEAAQRQNELAEEEYVLSNQVMDAIKTFIAQYNKEHQFALIFTTSVSTNVVIEGNKALDITSDVLAGLNSEYIKNRNK